MKDHGAERARLAASVDRGAPWRRWGPFLAERAWGTVREDYSATGEAWDYFPHDHARSRAYRWNEDGLGGICDRDQHMCVAFAFWNGRDPILKERIFGLTGPQGNRGEDPKELWFYVDSTPTHSWMRWRYFYPQGEFPYAWLVEESRRRGRAQSEFELLDTGIFDDDRYFDIAVDYAKAAPEDICMRMTVRNAGPAEAELDVLPTVWFRNTWSWGTDTRKPLLVSHHGEVVAEHLRVGRRVFAADTGPGGVTPALLFCENETNVARIFGLHPTTPFPKDGINDHVVHGAQTVNPGRSGTKAAFWHHLVLAPGEQVELRLRLCEGDERFGAAFDRVFERRRTEADEFYAELTPADTPPDEVAVMRQAFAGMLWSKQFYHFNVRDWLAGDPAGPPPPGSRRHGRNANWRHLDNFDVISMPDKWEYPWYAAWDSAFHCVVLAHVDIDFAKDQLLLFLKEWYQHPSGQIPAYEWAFDDVNPPVHAWAALRVFQMDGSRDFAFLAKVFHKLLLNFTWWTNKKDEDGNNVFEGGFLGLDNIGPIDRSAKLPDGYFLEQSDGTAWMAMYSLNMLTIALNLAQHEPVYEDIASKFFEHFAHIAAAINASEETGLWDESDGFYYDILHVAGQPSRPMRVRSMVGLAPLFAVETLGPTLSARFPDFAKRKRWFVQYRVSKADLGHIDSENGRGARLLSIVSPERLRRILATMLDEDEFLSGFGIRSLSAYHRAHPLVTDFGSFTSTVGYEPAESSQGMFGGNSNWRGPIWFPVNYLLLDSLREFHKFVGNEFTVEYPTGSGVDRTLAEVAEDLEGRLVSLFLRGPDGRRPCFGWVDKLQTDKDWADVLLFHEYFHGDNGAGLGASHQTGWTGLVADLITRRRFRRN